MKKKWLLFCLIINTLSTFGQSKLIRSNWNLIFEENFDTYATVDDMSSKWRFDYPWGPTLVGNTSENQYYTKENIILNPDGTITFRAKKLSTPIVYEWEDATGLHSKKLDYTSGMIFSKQEFDNPCWAGNIGYTHGFFEMRCKLPKGLKTWAAWWLYSGPTEIDIFEAYDDKRGFASNNHDWHDPHTSCGNHFQKEFGDDLTNEYHNYGCVWTEDKIIMFFDDVEIWSSDRIGTTACPATLIANLAMIKGARIDSTDFIVDYIKVYKMVDPQLPFKTENAWTNNIIDNQKFANRKVSGKPGSIVQINENEIAYVKRDNTLGRFIKSSNNWVYSEIPFTYQNAQKINSNLVAAKNGNYTYYRGLDGKIHGFAFTNGNWSNFIVDDGNNATYSKINAAAGSMVVDLANNIFYRGNDNKLHKYSNANGIWVHTLISNTTSTNDLIAGNLVLNAANTIYYRGNDANLHNYNLQGSNYLHLNYSTFPKIEKSNYSLSGKELASLSQPFMLAYIEKGSLDLFYSFEQIVGLKNPIKITPTNENIRAKSNLSISSSSQIWYKGEDGKINFLKNENGKWTHQWPSSWDNKNPVLNASTDNIITFSDELMFHRSTDNFIKKIELKPFISPNPPCDVNDYTPDPLYRMSNINAEINIQETFKIFPNPSSERIFFEVPYLMGEKSEIRIINTTGQIILEKTVFGGNQSLDITNIEDGIYFAILNTNNKQSISKFIVKK